MDVVRTAIRVGAEEAYIVYRRSADEMPADKEEVAEAIEEGVKFCYLNAPVEILGDKNGKVNGLKVEIMELGEPDEKGKRKPCSDRPVHLSLGKPYRHHFDGLVHLRVLHRRRFRAVR